MKYKNQVKSLTLALIPALLATLGTSKVLAETYDWNGFYIGGNLGYGSAESPSFDPNAEDPNPKGAVGGAQLGYNWQIEDIVIGIETDFSGSGMSHESERTAYASANQFSEESKINSFATLRMRLGVLPADNLLLYGTAGIAGAHVEQTSHFSSGGTNLYYPVSHNSTQFGWTVGAGAEYGLSESLTVKAEYLYLILEDDTAIDTDGTLDSSWETRANIFRVGLNYLF